jgi:DUF971 family protein
MGRINPMTAPEKIALLGPEVAILWQDGTENYYPMEFLREKSPSADNMGETDLLGNRYGGDGTAKFPGVMVKGWNMVGGYAVQFHFSDGHNTGLFSYDYLKQLAGML